VLEEDKGLGASLITSANASNKNIIWNLSHVSSFHPITNIYAVAIRITRKQFASWKFFLISFTMFSSLDIRYTNMTDFPLNILHCVRTLFRVVDCVIIMIGVIA